MFLEAKQHRESHERRFYRFQNAKQGRADVFQGNLKEAKLNQCV